MLPTNPAWPWSDVRALDDPEAHDSEVVGALARHLVSLDAELQRLEQERRSVLQARTHTLAAIDRLVARHSARQAPVVSPHPEGVRSMDTLISKDP